MRLRYGAIDANQRDIVQALRRAGRRVLVLSRIGDGCCDLLVAWRDNGPHMLLMEVKDGEKPPSARRLTPDEQEFHRNWQGFTCIVTSVAEALAATGAVAVGSARAQARTG